MNLSKLIEAVKSVSNVEDLMRLGAEFGLQHEKSLNPYDQILSIYKGAVDGQSVTVTHRWYDRCKTYQIQPDGNKVELEVDGKQLAVGSFLDDK